MFIVDTSPNYNNPILTLIKLKKEILNIDSTNGKVINGKLHSFKKINIKPGIFGYIEFKGKKLIVIRLDNKDRTEILESKEDFYTRWEKIEDVYKMVESLILDDYWDDSI